MTADKRSWNKKIKPDENMIELAEDEETQLGMGGFTISIGDGSRSGSRHKEREASDPDPNMLRYDSSQGDRRGPLPAVVGLTRTINGREQRIVVAGDADFLSNAELGRYNIKTCNFNFSTAIFSWFAHGEFPIDTSRPPSEDKRVNLTDSGLAFLKVMLMGILPGLLLVFGSILLIRRKRK
jgi:ABC-2 type transport system permease protein